MGPEPPSSPTTAAFHLQAVLSFAVSLLAVGIALWNLPADPVGDAEPPDRHPYVPNR